MFFGDWTCLDSLELNSVKSDKDFFLEEKRKEEERLSNYLLYGKSSPLESVLS